MRLFTALALSLLSVGVCFLPAQQTVRTSSASFRQTLYPVLEAARCRDCHTDNGVASASRLRFPAEDASAADVEAFGLSLRRLVDAGNPSASLLLNKPTNRVAHPGGERLKQGSDDERVLRQWIDYLATIPESAALRTGPSARAGRPMLRRLTNSQYNNTVADLLGDTTRPANRFPAEDVINGFTNQSDGQSISPLLAEDYNRAASRLAVNARRSGALAALIPCKAFSHSCATEFIKSFGLKAFRRPPTPEEVSRLTKLVEVGSKRTDDPLDGAQLAVESMLQSPAFLFQTGEGAYATASRLSYLFWDTMPDAALLDAARSGRLDRPAEVAATARRMLDDPRAHASLNQFLEQWLRFDRLKSALRERRLYPEFGAELAAAMAEETTRLFEHVVWNDRNFLDFYNARYTFLNSSLAQLYGTEAPAQEWSRVDWAADSKRAGVLGQASFLTITSKPAETSPTERGLFIRSHFLCQEVPPPPPGVDTTLPQLSEDRPLNNKQRLAMHLNNAGCAGCHRLVDSIGFGFEQFDAIGRYHDEQIVLVYPDVEKSKKNTRREGVPTKLAVDTTATILGLPGSTFTTPAGAADVLARSEPCQRCIVKQLFRFAAGRMETEADRPELDRLFARFRDSGFKFRELTLAIATSPAFLDNAGIGRLSNAR